MSCADWFWEVLSPNGLFYSLEERKEKSCCLCACYQLFDLKRLPRKLRLTATTRLLKTKRSIILSHFWFEDFLLVWDVIKPPETYFNNNIDCRISLISSYWRSLKFSSSFPATRWGGGVTTSRFPYSRLPYLFVPLSPDSRPLLYFSRHHVNYKDQKPGFSVKAVG